MESYAIKVFDIIIIIIIINIREGFSKKNCLV